MKRLAVKAAMNCGLVTMVAALLSAIGAAWQAVPVTAGVYSAAQAERGRPVYQARCATCHGDRLQGGAGSPLSGPDFLSNWSARPLADLVDKIHKTMPFEAPGTLSRQQSIDLTAYVLQGGQFPAGRADLTEGALAGIVLPTVRGVAAPAASALGSLAPPLGNLSEVMRAIAFPSSNIIFNLQVKDPTNAPNKPMPIPFDYVEWGYTIYPGWLSVDQAAVALAEAAPLLLTPGRRCQNGRPAPVDRPDWKKYVDDMARKGREIYAASKARKYETLVTLAEQLNDTCANCHKVYRDNGGQEGSGANRCMAVP